MDAATGLCAGCSRSLDEIAGWSAMDAAAKQETLARIAQRQKEKGDSPMTTETPRPPPEQVYVCIGICTTDPDSGYCLGCGRPPESSPTPDSAADSAKPA